MTKLTIICTVLLFSVTQNSFSQNIDIGEALNIEWCKNPMHILKNAGQVSPGFVIEFESVEYIAVEGGGKIEFLSTYDPNFTTSEGYCVGTQIFSEACVVEPGWCTSVLLPSGWYAASYCEGGCDCSKLTIEWFYKRK